MAGKEWHLASVFEQIADRIPDQTASLHKGRRRTYREFEDRAARLAAALSGLGVEHETKVALCMRNCPEYKEAQFATFKLRGVAVNVNYRYLQDELVHLLGDADAEILIFQRQFADRIGRVRDRLPKLRVLIQVDDGSGHDLADALDLEALIAAGEPAPRIERSPSDLVINYTGGTTGLPKGVMIDQEASVRLYTFGYEFYGLPTPSTVDELVEAATGLARSGQAPVCLVCVPYMHNTGSGVGHTMTTIMGGTVITLASGSFDPAEALDLIQAERVTQLVIVGDAIAKPLIMEIRDREARGEACDLSSLRLIASAGVMWTKEVKQALLDRQDMTLIDFFGATEGGMGMSLSNRSEPPGTARFKARPNIKLLDDDGSELPWGTGKAGRFAATGNVPFGYYKSPEKTAATFLTIDGVRYSVPGDYGFISADGEMTVLGRGSSCINTGGEKVFAEEVETVIKRDEGVFDCLVVGVPDPKYGASVTALVSLKPGVTASGRGLAEVVRGRLAGYKVPRRFIFVDEVKRGPNGKPDYDWAATAAGQGT